jgi:hypothetical protein
LVSFTSILSLPKSSLILSAVAQSFLSFASFAPFSENLIMIKEVAGTSLFYPQFDIFTLTTLSPGKAYFVKVIQPFTITY